MDFNKTIYQNKLILAVDSEIIDDILTDKILKYTKNYKKTGLDMKKVRNIQSKKFIRALLDNKFKLFNLESNVLTYLSLILKDGFLKSHINISDLLENKRELVKRHFLVA